MPQAGPRRAALSPLVEPVEPGEWTAGGTLPADCTWSRERPACWEATSLRNW